MNETEIPRHIIERSERRWAEKLKQETQRWQESGPVRPATVSKVETDVPVVRSLPSNTKTAGLSVRTTQITLMLQGS
jgi:hypothetical protein